MKIILEKINWKKIKNEIDIHLETEFNSFNSFKRLAKDLNHELTISLIATNTIITILNTYDYKVQELNNFSNPPINSLLFGVDPYTNKELFSSKFNYEIIKDEVELFLEVNPLDDVNKHLLFSLEKQFNVFKEYLIKNKKELLEESISETFKTQLLQAFEKVKTFVNFKEEEMNKIGLKMSVELIIREIAFALVQLKMPLIYERYLIENNKK